MRFFLQNQEFEDLVDIMRFLAKLFVSLTGSRHLGEMKTSTDEGKLVN